MAKPEVPRLVAALPVLHGQSVTTGSSDDGNAEWASVPAKFHGSRLGQRELQGKCEQYVTSM